jgi:hypothetical protein
MACEKSMSAFRSNDLLPHSLAYAFATSFLFGLATVLNAANIQFVFYYPRRVQITLIDARVDVLVWVASTLCLFVLAIWYSKNQDFRAARTVIALLGMTLSLALLVPLENGILAGAEAYLLFGFVAAEFTLLALWNAKHPDNQLRISVSLVLIYFLAYFAVIEMSSATFWVVRSFGSQTQVGLLDSAIELNFSYVTYGLIPWLYLGFLFSWAWVPLAQRLILRSKTFQNLFRAGGDQDESSPKSNSSGDWTSILLDPRLYLVMAVALFVAYYPYFQNPPWLVGTDAYWRYFDPLKRMNLRGGLGGFAEALAERHPVPLAILYAVQLIFHATAFNAVRYTPIFLVVTLALFAWIFLARGRSMNFGLIVFLLSTFSVVTTVGFYSSILANWMALVCWVFFFAYAGFVSDVKLRTRDVLVLLIVSTAVLLLHPWTWGVFAAAVIIAAILTFQERKLRRSATILLLVISLTAVLALVSFTFLAGSQGWREIDAIDLYTYVINNPSTVLFFWDAVKRLTEIWSPFFSSLYIALSIIGVFALRASNLSTWRRNLIIGWLCVSALGSILVAPIGFDPARPTETESQLWRLFFLTPFFLTAPFGIAWIAKIPSRFRSAVSDKLRGAASTDAPIWLGVLLVLGFVLASLPVWGRPLILLAILPLSTGFFLVRCEGEEAVFLSDIMIATFLLVAFNNTARSLSQLLIDPHNARF